MLCYDRSSHAPIQVAAVGYSRPQSYQTCTVSRPILNYRLNDAQGVSQARLYSISISKRASITSTFDEVKANKLIGMQIPGSIIREECDPYLYTVPESGEEIELSHTYKYVPNPVTVEEEVFA